MALKPESFSVLSRAASVRELVKQTMTKERSQEGGRHPYHARQVRRPPVSRNLGARCWNAITAIIPSYYINHYRNMLITLEAPACIGRKRRVVEFYFGMQDSSIFSDFEHWISKQLCFAMILESILKVFDISVCAFYSTSKHINYK